MFSVVGASGFFPFLPMLPIQVQASLLAVAVLGCQLRVSPLVPILGYARLPGSSRALLPLILIR